MIRGAGTQAGVTAAFAVTMLLSAALMFGIQPMTGKMLLPAVGGSPAGWIVAMAFFQVMLLAGYFFAHLLSKLKPRMHGLVYLLGLLAGATFLPVSLSHATAGAVPGAVQVFTLLARALAIPFVALSATSSTVQRLFTVTRHEAARDPYFLYAASNIGSMAGLLLYPLFFEPALGLHAQARWLAAGYAALVGMAVVCLGMTGAEKEKTEEKSSKTVTFGQHLEWLALAFFPCCLLMAVTTYITSDVVSAPLVWILPLALYLLTFIVAFARKPLLSLKAMELLHPYAIGAGVVMVSLIRTTWLASWGGVAFYLVIFFVVAQACHLRLASLRPVHDTRRLTAFYLMLSLGGALGGIVNAFIIPNVFDRLFEFPLTLLASFMVHKDFRARNPAGLAVIGMTAASLLLINLPPLKTGIDNVHAREVLSGMLYLGIGYLAVVNRKAFRPAYITLGAFALFMLSQFVFGEPGEILSQRNFFGTIRVYDLPENIGGRQETLRIMRHGSTIHGKQVVGGPLELEPTAYYSRQGPLGDIFRAYKPRRVAVLGLGAGATNCYAAPDREFTYLEIDPAVVRMAETEFTFLGGCKSKKPPRIILGDGRLALAALHEKFDLLTIDVFTSDSIPTHVITREALKLYFDRLAPGGTLAVHISNRYFRLWDMIAATAATLGLKTEMRADLNPDLPDYISSSIWLAVRRTGDRNILSRNGWHEVKPSGTIRPWTDDYTNLLSTLAWRNRLTIQK